MLREYECAGERYVDIVGVTVLKYAYEYTGILRRVLAGVRRRARRARRAHSENNPK